MLKYLKCSNNLITKMVKRLCLLWVILVAENKYKKRDHTPEVTYQKYAGPQNKVINKKKKSDIYKHIRPPLSKKLFPVCRVGKRKASRRSGIFFFFFFLISFFIN